MTDITTLSVAAHWVWKRKVQILGPIKWAYSQLEEKRLITAREILIEEIKKGQADIIIDASEVDNFVAITHRYFRAAEEGSARLNMRLMAKVVAGQKLSGNLSADQFLHHADVLASLTINEIILLGTFYAVYQQEFKSGHNDHTSAGLATAYVRKNLVPNPFEDHKELMATAHAVTRTGLLLPHPGAIGGPTFEPTILFDRLYKLANFKEAIDQEILKKDPPLS